MWYSLLTRFRSISRLVAVVGLVGLGSAGCNNDGTPPPQIPPQVPVDLAPVRDLTPAPADLAQPPADLTQPPADLSPEPADLTSGLPGLPGLPDLSLKLPGLPGLPDLGLKLPGLPDLKLPLPTLDH